MAAPGNSFEVPPNLIAQWKRQAGEGLVEVFGGKANRGEAVGEAPIKELHAKIGQLTIERDFLARASGRRAASGGKEK